MKELLNQLLEWFSKILYTELENINNGDAQISIRNISQIKNNQLK